MSNKLSNLHKASRLLKLLGWLSMISVVGISTSILLPIFYSDEIPEDFYLIVILIILAVGISIFYLFVGNAVKKDKKWAKIAGVIIAALSLLSFPLGTLIGGIILFYFYRGWDEQNQTTSETILDSLKLKNKRRHNSSGC